MNQPEPIRVFIAIQADAAIKKKLAAIQRELHCQGVRWTPPDQIHLTLKFLGEIESTKLGELEVALRKSIGATAPFQLTVEALGGFPNLSKPNIIWAGIGGELMPLMALQQRVDYETVALSEHVEKRSFHPHLTLGRVKLPRHPATREIAKTIEWLKIGVIGEISVRSIEIMRSELSSKGTRHVTVAVLPLEASPS